MLYRAVAIKGGFVQPLIPYMSWVQTDVSQVRSYLNFNPSHSTKGPVMVFIDTSQTWQISAPDLESGYELFQSLLPHLAPFIWRLGLLFVVFLVYVTFIASPHHHFFSMISLIWQISASVLSTEYGISYYFIILYRILCLQLRGGL